MEHIFLSNVDHIISMELFKEKISTRFTYVPQTQKIKKRLFRENKIINIPSHYTDTYGYYIGDSIYDIKSYILSNKYDQFILIERKNTNYLDEKIIQYDIYEKAYIRIKMTGGKYIEEKYIRFDNNDDAINFIHKVKDNYGDKFLIIEEN